ncbi:MAG: O-antigen ligase family protein [Lacrimispora sphenoides]
MKLKRKKTQDNKDIFVETCSSIINGVISFFIILLVLVFPLIYNNSYIDILVVKYQFYWVCVVVMLALCLVLSLIMLVIDILKYRGDHAKMFISGLLPKNWRKTFCVADISILIFWIILVISTVQSDYVYESFWGNEGRYSGLFLLTLYVASYFMVNRFWRFKGWVLDIFLISGMVVCYIGITDYFRMDIFNFRVNIVPEHWDIFTSTIGNINTYTAYIALILGVAAAWFAITKSKVRAIWCYLCMVVGFFAIIMGCSDNAYLALAALFGFLPLVLFKSKTGIKRYLLMSATFVTVLQCIDFINHVYVDTVIGLDGLFQILVNINGLTYVTVGLWVAYIAVYILINNNCNKNCNKNDQVSPMLVYCWGGLVVLGILVVAFIVFDTNVLGNSEKYGAMGKYLVFNDSWGTNRGYIWRKSVELYKDFKPMHKIFGYGLDTFGILAKIEIGAEMPERFESIHNEYLHYIITIGLAGFIAYVIFLGSAITYMWKNIQSTPIVVCCCFATICYALQAIVNINLPIATPMMWLLLSIGIAGCKKR